MRCNPNPTCMAWVNKAAHPSNQNRVVTVHKDFIQGPRGHMWLVTCGEKMIGVDMHTGAPGYIAESLYCYDTDLTPINDPGLDTKDVGKDRPVEKPVEKKEEAVEKWEWPNV